MWVAKVLVDVLRQGVSQGLLTEPEEVQVGVAEAAMAPQFFMLGQMLMTMLHCAEQQPRATRTYIFRDSNQEIFQILQVPLVKAYCIFENYCLSPWLNNVHIRIINDAMLSSWFSSLELGG